MKRKMIQLTLHSLVMYFEPKRTNQEEVEMAKKQMAYTDLAYLVGCTLIYGKGSAKTIVGIVVNHTNFGFEYPTLDFILADGEVFHFKHEVVGVIQEHVLVPQEFEGSE